MSTTNRPSYVTALLDENLSDTEFRTWMLIYRYQGGNGSAWPSQERIAGDLGRTVEGTRKIIKRLEQYGWLKIIRPASTARGRGLAYEVTTPGNAPTAIGVIRPNGGLGDTDPIAPTAKLKTPQRPSRHIKGRSQSLNRSCDLPTIKLTFDWQTFSFVNVPDDLLRQWAAAYPLVDVPAEIPRAAVWCRNNQRKARRRSEWDRFLNNWLARAQGDAEAAGRGKREPPAAAPVVRGPDGLTPRERALRGMEAKPR